MTHPRTIHLLYFNGKEKHLWDNFGKIYSNLWFSIKLTKTRKMVQCARVVVLQARGPKFKPPTCKNSGVAACALWHMSAKTTTENKM